MELNEIDDITKEYGNFSLSQLLANEGRNHSIYIYDVKSEELTRTSGIEDIKIEKFIKDRIKELGGISAFYFSKKIEGFEKEVFVLGVNNEFLHEGNELKKELILFHEVCHYLELTGKYKDFISGFTDLDNSIGDKISEIANEVYDRTSRFGKDEYHNQTFGSILFHFLYNYDKERSHELLDIAMIKNFGDPYKDEFRNVIQLDKATKAFQDLEQLYNNYKDVESELFKKDPKSLVQIKEEYKEKFSELWKFIEDNELNSIKDDPYRKQLMDSKPFLLEGDYDKIYYDSPNGLLTGLLWEIDKFTTTRDS